MGRGDGRQSSQTRVTGQDWQTTTKKKYKNTVSRCLSTTAHDYPNADTEPSRKGARRRCSQGRGTSTCLLYDRFRSEDNRFPLAVSRYPHFLLCPRELRHNFVRQTTDSTTDTARLQKVKTRFFIKLSREELSPGHMDEPVFTARKPYVASPGACAECGLSAARPLKWGPEVSTTSVTAQKQMLSSNK